MSAPNVIIALNGQVEIPGRADQRLIVHDFVEMMHAFLEHRRTAVGIDADLVPGVTLNGQFWSRDPDHPDGTGVHLTEAIEAPICP